MIELLLQAERAMSVGLVDRAEVLYRQVAEADPQNSIAVVGLARVALERGDEAGAVALARRALTIDPENAAAARMVERLDEVLAYRADAAGVADGVEAATEAPPPPSEPEPVTAEPGPVAVAEPVAVAPAAPSPAKPAPASPIEPRRRSFLERLFGRFGRHG